MAIPTLKDEIASLPLAMTTIPYPARPTGCKANSHNGFQDLAIVAFFVVKWVCAKSTPILTLRFFCFWIPAFFVLYYILKYTKKCPRNSLLFVE